VRNIGVPYETRFDCQSDSGSEKIGAAFPQKQNWEVRAMKWYGAGLFCLALCAINANAQTPTGTVESHVAAAKAAAKEDFGVMNLCNEPQPAAGQRANTPAQRTIPPASQWYAEPAKVFDNLYFIGSKDVSAWAITTSDGIILIDSLYDYSVEQQIADGLKKLSLDPARIKYVLVTHGHGDHYLGSKFLQDRYGARIILSEADWNLMANDRNAAQLKPKKDMVATDGQKLTLGDTTLTLYVTPGHTPGTISWLMPIKDGNQRHLAGMWGGVGFNFQRTPQAFRTYGTSARRFQEIAAKAGVDVLLTNHANQDKTLDKIAALKARRAGGAHPFVVGADNVKRFMTVVSECADAQYLRMTSASK
jgi:metallo-beta-lactamase class B